MTVLVRNPKVCKRLYLLGQEVKVSYIVGVDIGGTFTDAVLEVAQ